MKIFYTNKFKEVLTKPYKQIELGKYKLRGGNNTGFNELTSDNIESRQFLSTTSPTSTGDEENYYTAQIIEYNNGLQISLEVPETDHSIYINDPLTNKTYYQIFLFYFTENKTTSLAFILFENFNEGSFHGLEYNSNKLIITLPNFNRKCNLILDQNQLTSTLENNWGQKLDNVTSIGKDIISQGNKYVSVISWEKFWVENMSKENDLNWIETVFLNNFGLKIY